MSSSKSANLNALNTLLNSSFALGLLAILSVFIKVCADSRCSNCSIFWGCINIVRDTHAEEREHELALQNQNTPPPSEVVTVQPRPPSPHLLTDPENL